MTSKIKAVLKLAAAALLSFTIAPLYANGAPFVPPAQILGFTEANQTPPFITSKDMTRGAVSDGSLTFSLDMFFGTNTQNSFAISPMIQYDSAKLDIIEIANVAHAGFFKPEPSRINDRKFKIADWSRKPAFAGADTEFLLVWMDLNEITAVSGATPENPVRLATIKFKWKAGATGASQIAIVESEAGISDENFRGVSVDIQGIEAAEAAAAVVGAFAPPEPDIWISHETIETAESKDNSATATFSVRLAAPPIGGKVVVGIHSLKPTEATVSPESKELTFTAFNWDEERSVTVIGKDDSESDGHQPYEIKLEVNKDKTGATHYHGVTASVSGINKDNETFATLSDLSLFCTPKGEQKIAITANLENPAPERGDIKVFLTKAATDTAEHSGESLGEILLPDGTDSKGETFQINVSTDNKTFRIDGKVEEFESGEIHVASIESAAGKFALDVDLEGGVNARDGIMAMRYLLGVQDEKLTARQSNAKHADVAKCLSFGVAQLNVDGNDLSDHDDGALIARYLFGLRGNDLAAELILETDLPSVVEKIKVLCPDCKE